MVEINTTTQELFDNIARELKQANFYLDKIRRDKIDAELYIAKLIRITRYIVALEFNDLFQEVENCIGELGLTMSLECSRFLTPEQYLKTIKCYHDRIDVKINISSSYDHKMIYSHTLYFSQTK